MNCQKIFGALILLNVLVLLICLLYLFEPFKYVRTSKYLFAERKVNRTWPLEQTRTTTITKPNRTHSTNITTITQPTTTQLTPPVCPPKPLIDQLDTRCMKIRRRVSEGVIDYAKWVNDSDLNSLITPIFTKKKLVVWSLDHHPGTISDIRSFFEPLGVEFLEHTLYEPCNLFCTCNQLHSFKILGFHDLLRPISANTIKRFLDAYSNDCDFQRSDAFLNSWSAPLFDVFVEVKRPVIYIASMRLDTAIEGDPNGWNRMSRRIQRLVDNPENIFGANNKYDFEYIKYFTGRTIDYIPSFCAYTGYYYKPTRNSFLKARKIYWHLIAGYWDPKFNSHYNRTKANFKLEAGSYEPSDIISNRGVLHIPYEVSYMSLFEQYRMDIPIFAPSLKFLVFLDLNFHVVQDRTRRAPWRRGVPPPRGSDIGPNALIRSRQSVPDPNAAYNVESITYWLSLCDI